MFSDFTRLVEDTGGEVSARPAHLEEIRYWRDMYRQEMSCQVVRDSIHDRPGWTREYLLAVAGISAGYGSLAVSGPWTGQPTAYEFHVVPDYRSRLFDLYRAFLDVSGAVSAEAQTNDPLGMTMLHTFASGVKSESILFHDRVLTSHYPPGATFREPTVLEEPDVPAAERRWRGVVEIDGQVGATGGILFHYNRPFGDIYMDVAEPFRRRGLGTFIVQELKRICREDGHVPVARCHPGNIASRRTLQKAGLVPCGHILKGSLRAPEDV